LRSIGLVSRPSFSFTSTQALDAAKGMQYLHELDPPIVHRDLKSPNLLVTADFGVKVSDFNLSKILDDSTRSSSLAAMNPRWLAPEVFSDNRPNKACDVFAFGVILWELMTWDLPWGNKNPWTVRDAELLVFYKLAWNSKNGKESYEKRMLLHCMELQHYDDKPRMKPVAT
jgi:serine/threonine protein kinase